MNEVIVLERQQRRRTMRKKYYIENEDIAEGFPREVRRQK